MEGHLTNIKGTSLKEQLSFAWEKQRNIAHNIANANTAGFQANRLKNIQRDQQILLELDQSNSQHLKMTYQPAGVSKEAVPIEDFSLDSEIGEMSKNSIFYQTLIETVNRRSRMSRSVIEGR